DDERLPGLEAEVDHAVLPVLRRDLPDRLVLEDHPVEEDQCAGAEDDRGEVVAASPARAEGASTGADHPERAEGDQERGGNGGELRPPNQAGDDARAD